MGLRHGDRGEMECPGRESLAGAESEQPVILISTRTVDHLPRPGGRVHHIPGGPATYMAEAFARLGRPYTLITGDRVEVQVLPGEGGQEYVIPSIPPIRLPERLTAPAVVISPIIGEVPHDSIPHIDGLVVVDLQGFVREPDRPTGDPTHQFELAELLHRTDVVKASSAEISWLTAGSRAALEHLILLETHGGQGLVLRQGNQQTHIPAAPLAPVHTIGAGDTLLAGFVHVLLCGEGPESAARQAVAFTERVLRERMDRTG
jgi:sugar/nucleoside kinase (ribokinase family)